MRSAGSAGSPDPESNSKPRVGSLTLASPLPQLADGHSPSTADGLVPLLVEMVKRKDIFSVVPDMLQNSVTESGFRNYLFQDGIFFVLILLFPHGFIHFITFLGMTYLFYLKCLVLFRHSILS